TLFKTRFLDAFLRSVYAIPIDRGGIDIAAIKQVIEIVSRGEVILIFPEGTRTLDGNLQPVRQGIGFVMKRAHADVLPCYIDGSWEILPRGRKMVRFHKLKVVFGEMIRYRQFAELPSDKEHYQKISNFVMEKIGELKAKIERE
ncbi:MAG TPA: lysophospholipid acyltransferase family protein, partial [bacterium]|nr:lysophospholipid acyltransferase family protein [bacterium]